jgi:hypothetical protein
MKVRIIGLAGVNLILAVLFCIQGSFVVHPRHIRYDGKHIGVAMLLLGPPCGVSFSRTRLLLHYKNQTHKDFDLAFSRGHVSLVYMRE